MSPFSIVSASLSATLKPLVLLAAVVAVGTVFPTVADARERVTAPTPATSSLAAMAAPADEARPSLGQPAALAGSAVAVSVRAFLPRDLPLSAFGDADDAAR